MTTQEVFAALADPTRRQIIELLCAEGDKTATELAGVFPMSRQGVSKHLGILEEAGLVAVEKTGRERRYSLSPDPLSSTVSWVEQVRRTWDQRLLRLRDYLLEDTNASDK